MEVSWRVLTLLARSDQLYRALAEPLVRPRPNDCCDDIGNSRFHTLIKPLQARAKTIRVRADTLKERGCRVSARFLDDLFKTRRGYVCWLEA
jgi:hypothetical protein